MIPPDQIRAFSQALRRLAVLYMRVAGQQSAAHETLGKQDLMALGVLGLQEPCRMGEIAAHLAVVQSAVTPLVDRLEGQGMVRRRRSEADRRVWLVELTERGRETFAAEDEVYGRIAAEMLSPLSASERATLIGLFERMWTSAPEG